MCGICGFAAADPGRPVDRAAVERMTATLVHRGPDGDGVHTGLGIGLGVRRLSIIDLATGDQPIANEDGRIVVVCNGEIYNSPELRQELERGGHRFRSRSDVEVIVHLYEELGPDLVTRLRGMFAFAVWDAPAQRLLLARDRLGIKPLVYAQTAAGLWFGSEAKAILAGGALARDCDPLAIGDLFTFGFVRTPRTLFAGIRRLPPAHLLLWQRGTPTLRRYWRAPLDSAGTPRSEAEWAEALLAKLAETVRLHLRSDVEVGAWLSPGVDSSGVVSLARTALGKPLHTVTLAFSDPVADETRGSPTLDTYPGYSLPNERAVCDTASFELFPDMVWHCEEASAHAIEIPHLILARVAARSTKVVLCGEGADELFGGYPYVRWNTLGAAFARLPLRLRRLLLGRHLAARHPWAVPMLLAPAAMVRERYRSLIGVVHESEAAGVLAGDLRRQLARAGGEEPWPLSAAEAQALPPFAALQRCEMEIRLPDYILHITDRTSMACGLEARVPFLDHELVELCAGIPSSLKRRRRTEKYILRRALAPVLPAAICGRRKRGLQAPAVAWWRGPLPAFAEEMLSEDRLRESGHFAPGAVAELLLRHRGGLVDTSQILTAVLGLQVWDELFRKRRSLGGVT